MQLELHYIIVSSLLIGLNVALGFYFVISSSNLKPFKILFAIECFLLAAQELLNVFEPIFSQLLGGRDLGLLSVAKDLTLVPVCYMEVESLVRQDITRYPWHDRIRKMCIHEVPFIILIALAYFWPSELVTLLVYWFAIGYIIACAVILNSMVLTYERQMASIFGPRSGYSLKWIYFIILLLIAFAVLFIGFSMTDYRDNLMYIYLYSPCLAIINLSHAYFIDRQRIPMKAIVRPHKNVDSLGY